jgi:hypothetical protein
VKRRNGYHATDLPYLRNVCPVCGGLLRVNATEKRSGMVFRYCACRKCARKVRLRELTGAKAQ